MSNNDLAEVHWLSGPGAYPFGITRRHVYPFERAFAPAERERVFAEGGRLLAARFGAAQPPAVPAASVRLEGVAAPRPLLPVDEARSAAGLLLGNGESWVVCEDRGGYRRGQVLVALPVGAGGFGNRAVVHGAGCLPVSVSGMTAAELGDLIKGDSRTLPANFDAQGARKRTFADSVALMSEDVSPGGWLVQGPRSSLNTLKGVVEIGGSPEIEHDQWVRMAKLPDSDRSVFEDVVIAVCLQTLASVDQLNLPNLAGVELMIRRRALLREAHRVSPSSPDYTAAQHYMGWSRRRDAGAVDDALNKHVAERLRDEAAIAKETRKAREERQLRAKPAPSLMKGSGTGEAPQS